MEVIWYDHDLAVMAVFSFILRPYWLWMSLLLLVCCLSSKNNNVSHRNLFNPVLLAFLISSQVMLAKRHLLQRWAGSPLYCQLVLALAGPAVQQIPQPIYQAHRLKSDRDGYVVIDASGRPKPNRLSQARYKAMDYVNGKSRSQYWFSSIYAVDAFTSLVTQDGKNLNALIPSLRPGDARSL